MDDFEELRYPFESLLDFLRGGYWAEPAGWPLVLGGLLYLLLVLWVVWRTRNTFRTLLILYLTTSIFNNPAYSYGLGGLDVSQLAGIGAAGLFLASRCRHPAVRTAPIAGTLLVLWAVCSLHVALIALLTPVLQSSFGLRTVLLGKITVLAINLLAFTHLADAALVATLLRAQVGASSIACLVYGLQGALFLTGTVPYGTYWDAAFTGVPSFGSVSIERGHLGKFLVPTLPLLLLAAAQTRRRWPVVVVVGTSLVNFSASAMAFLASYGGVYGWLYRHRLLQPRLLLALGLGSSVVAGGVALFREQYSGVIAKIVQVGLAGEEGGGRSLELLWLYLSTYPLGLSYGGSALRVAPGLPEINMGLYVWVSQLSLLALPLLALVVWLHVRLWHQSRPWLSPAVRRILLGGMLVAGVIGVVDVLWFIPTLWLPITLATVLAREARRTAPHRSL